MWVVYWTTEKSNGELEDHYSVFETEAEANRQVALIEDLDSTYCWGLSPVRRSSDWEAPV